MARLCVLGYRAGIMIHRTADGRVLAHSEHQPVTAGIDCTQWLAEVEEGRLDPHAWVVRVCRAMDK